MFGLGRIEAKFFKDVAVGLPPLNQVLARRLLEIAEIDTNPLVVSSNAAIAVDARIILDEEAIQRE